MSLMISGRKLYPDPVEWDKARRGGCRGEKDKIFYCPSHLNGSVLISLYASVLPISTISMDEHWSHFMPVSLPSKWRSGGGNYSCRSSSLVASKVSQLTFHSHTIFSFVHSRFTFSTFTLFILTFPSFVHIHWSVLGEACLAVLSVLDAGILYLMATSPNIWTAYVGYLLFRSLYQVSSISEILNHERFPIPRWWSRWRASRLLRTSVRTVTASFLASTRSLRSRFRFSHLSTFPFWKIWVLFKDFSASQWKGDFNSSSVMFFPPDNPDDCCSWQSGLSVGTSWSGDNWILSKKWKLELKLYILLLDCSTFLVGICPSSNTFGASQKKAPCVFPPKLTL